MLAKLPPSPPASPFPTTVQSALNKSVSIRSLITTDAFETQQLANTTDNIEVIWATEGLTSVKSERNDYEKGIQLIMLLTSLESKSIRACFVYVLRERG